MRKVEGMYEKRRRSSRMGRSFLSAAQERTKESLQQWAPHSVDPFTPGRTAGPTPTPTSREMCSCAEEHMFVLFKNLRNLTNLRHLINPSLTKLLPISPSAT